MISKDAFEDVPVILDVSYKTGRAYRSSNREHYHKSEYEIYYLVTGEKHFYVGDKIYQLRSGDVMFIPPLTVHRSVCPADGILSNRVVCLFNQDFIAPAMEFADSDTISRFMEGGPQKISLSTVGRSRFEILLRSLNEEISHEEGDYLCMCRMYVLQLCIYLLRFGISDVSYEKKSRSEVNMELVRSYIDSNFNKELSLHSLASRFYMNSSALSRSFKNATGQTVVGYINQKRIEKAKELLEERNCSIGLMADKLGFRTTTYFERMFKQTTGMTPTQYKNNMKEL